MRFWGFYLITLLISATRVELLPSIFYTYIADFCVCVCVYTQIHYTRSRACFFVSVIILIKCDLWDAANIVSIRKCAHGCNKWIILRSSERNERRERNTEHIHSGVVWFLSSLYIIMYSFISRVPVLMFSYAIDTPSAPTYMLGMSYLIE